MDILHLPDIVSELEILSDRLSSRLREEGLVGFKIG